MCFHFIIISGFGTGNQAIAAFIRPCFFDADPDCEVSVAKFKDAQPTLSETEERPFWIEYAEEGVVTAGKGGEQGEGLMVWDDVVDYHGHLPSVVHVSIASLMPADWLFHDFCEYMWIDLVYDLVWFDLIWFDLIWIEFIRIKKTCQKYIQQREKGLVL